MGSLARGFELLGPMEDDPSLFLVKQDDRFFRVSAASWEMIDGLSTGKTDDAIARNVQRYFASGALDAPRLTKIKAHVEAQLAAAAVSRKPMQLWGTIDLLGRERLGRLVDALPIFPSDVRWFYPLLWIAVAMNIAVMALVPDMLRRIPAAEMSRETIVQSAIVFLAMFLIMVLHELSHAAAVSRFGLRPAKIGAGLFLIFPALFADVSEVWRLRGAKRVVVNLAGVFTQLWIGVFLAATLLVAPAGWDPVICAIYIVNLGTIVLNLIPFAKLDGYWVLADAIGCADLHAEAFRALGRLFGRGTPSDRKRPSLETALGLFGFAHIAFYGAIALIAVSAVFHFLGGMIASASPVSFFQYSLGQHPIGFLTSAFLVYRLSGLMVKMLRPDRVGA